MSKKLVAKAEVNIDAPASRVWVALTKPELIKQYLFGTNTKTDWKVGSPITYEGEYQGKKYKDKGKILEVVPEKLLVHTYWSSMSGAPDTPENYKTVRYELFPDGNKTKLALTQDNNATEEEAKHNEGNWNMVLGKLKEIVEK